MLQAVISTLTPPHRVYAFMVLGEDYLTHLCLLVTPVQSPLIRLIEVMTIKLLFRADGY